MLYRKGGIRPFQRDQHLSIWPPMYQNLDRDATATAVKPVSKAMQQLQQVVVTK